MNIDGMRIEICLAEAGITKADLSKRCGISRQNLSTIVRRGTCEPRTLGKIAAALDVDVEQLLAKEA